MDGFFKRTLITTTVVTAVVAFLLWARQGNAAAAGCLILGAAVNLLMLSATIAWVMEAIRPPGEPRPRLRMMTILRVVKFLIAAAIIWWVTRYYAKDIVWLAVGYGIPLAVMVLKVLGKGLNRKLDIGSDKS